MAGLLDSLFGGGNVMQTTQTTAGLAPWSQPYVSSMLGAAQQQVFNTDPTTGQVTGIVPYMAFGAPVSAQGQPVPYQGGQQGAGYGYQDINTAMELGLKGMQKQPPSLQEVFPTREMVDRWNADASNVEIGRAHV